VTFFKPPEMEPSPEEKLVENYVRRMATGFGLRKPTPGFQPTVYSWLHSREGKTNGDPFADFLRNGLPDGPWLRSVIQSGGASKIAPHAGLRAAIHLHVFYPDQLAGIAERLRLNASAPDLFISATSEHAAAQTREALSGYRGRIVEVEVTPNLGRDIGPLLTQFGRTLSASYDVIGHLHTKKSVLLEKPIVRGSVEYVPAGKSGWRHIQARWIFVYRRGLLDIDEAGYTLSAFRHYNALYEGGFVAWILSVFEPSPVSPLTPGVASLMFAVFGPDPVYGFLVPVLLGVIAVIATYLLGKQVGGQSVGLASAALLATTPLILMYSRSFHFSIPATAITVLALLSLFKSKRAQDWGWVLAFGIFIGIMPLSRSMTLGFIPCVAGAALPYVIFEQDRWMRIGRLVIAGVVAVLTSLPWLWKSGSLVWWYLSQFGYGSRAVEFGPKTTWLGGVQFLMDRTVDQLYLPKRSGPMLDLILASMASDPAIGIVFPDEYPNIIFQSHAPTQPVLSTAARKRKAKLTRYYILSGAVTRTGSCRGGGWNWVGVVSGLFNSNDSGVGALERRPRDDEGYHEGSLQRVRKRTGRQAVKKPKEPPRPQSSRPQRRCKPTAVVNTIG
jgi:hypothetical protein